VKTVKSIIINNVIIFFFMLSPNLSNLFFLCKEFHLTFRTRDASEPDPGVFLLGGACHPVKGCNNLHVL
jgi:hypothetical protein